MIDNPRTKKGQEIVRYLQANPNETSPTTIAKATGATRMTAREYLRAWQERRQGAGQSAAEAPAKPATPAPEAAGKSSQGRDFLADYPPKPKPAPKAAPPKPPEDADDEPEEDDEDDDLEVFF